MVKDRPIWGGGRIMERWNISPTELVSWIYHGLPAYQMMKGEIRRVPPEEINYFDMNHMTDLVFVPSEIESFEKDYDLLPHEENGNLPRLSPKDSRELGQLRVEKANWDRSITAAVHIGIFCATKGGDIVRKNVEDEIIGLKFGLPDTTMDRIWQAIPGRFKHGPGRPKEQK